MNNLFKSAPAVTILLGINIALFLLTYLMDGQNNSLIFKLGLFYFDSPEFSPYQIITHMFMHGGFAHLLFNMFALLTFGSQLEALWGSKRFLIFYAITGLGAVLLHQAVQAYEVYQFAGSFTPGSGYGLQPGYAFSGPLAPLNDQYLAPVVGASGAIFGLLLGFGVLFPNAKLLLLFFPVPIKAKFVIPVLILIELFLGVRNFSIDNIAHFAHLGGALFGFILVKIWSYQGINKVL
jgi:rhomboid-like protein